MFATGMVFGESVRAGIRRVLPFALLAKMFAWPGTARSAAETPPRSDPSGRRPNIVFVLVDDMGKGDAGCYGAEIIRTPHLDALAGEGMKFTDAYSAAPMCSPTRASILTGLAPARLRLTDALPGRQGTPADRMIEGGMVQGLPQWTETLAERLGAAGYRSAMIGKWHLGGAGSEPTDHGFDMQFAVKPQVTVFSHLPPYGINDIQPNRPEQSLASRLTDEALEFMRECSAGPDRAPFFVLLSHYAVHTPLEAPRDRAASYQERLFRSGVRANAVYGAMVEILDDSIGELTAGIRRLGLEENTLLVFTSDNGSMMGASHHPYLGGKRNLYEGGVRVPLIARLPGVIPAGAECAIPVTSTDWYPTLLGLCGVPPSTPVSDVPPCDGADLIPLLTGRGEPPARSLFWHFPHYGFSPSQPYSGAPQLHPSGSVRSGSMKLIRSYEKGSLELFDLAADPGESLNLASGRPLTARLMDARLTRWLEGVSAAMPRRNPGMDPFGAPGEPWREPAEEDRSAMVLLLNGARDRHLERIDFFTQTDEIRLINGEISAAGMENLLKLPQLRAIHFINTAMPPGGCAVLARHTYISLLQLDGASVTDDDMAQLARMADLRILSVNRCPVTSAGVAHFRNYPAMRSISLSETPVDDAAIGALESMPLLRQINVIATGVTPEAAAAFRARHPDYNFQHSAGAR